MAEGDIWEISVSCTQFCCQSKAALKNSFQKPEWGKSNRDAKRGKIYLFRMIINYNKVTVANV